MLPVVSTGASLLPVIAKLAATLDVAVPSVTCTVKLSLTAWFAVKPWVAVFVLSSA